MDHQRVVMLIAGMNHRIELIAKAKPAPIQPCPGRGGLWAWANGSKRGITGWGIWIVELRGIE